MNGTDKRLAGVNQVKRDSPLYPPLLGEIFDPPVMLYYRGKLPDPTLPAIALVGTRRPSAAASRQALLLGREFARCGITVVSGLALGIDALAHRGALEGGGCTVAVLGSGLDEVYPASNRSLARRILENGGALVSEYPCGIKPQKWHFPQRNRIISGFSRGTVIIEAPASSGALYTGQFALEQGRDLWVASAGAASQLGAGCRRLASEGCRIISSAAEVLAEWGMDAAVLVEKNGGSRPRVRESEKPAYCEGTVSTLLAESLRRELSL
jgi:DNA processing protein